MVLYMLRVLSAKDDDSIAEELESDRIVGVAAVLRWNETRGRKGGNDAVDRERSNLIPGV